MLNFPMKRLIFPLVNGLTLAMLLGLLGYYLNNFLAGFMVGLLFGAAIGLLAELALKALGERIYRRRVLLVVLLEIPLMIFVVAPYAYVAVMIQPNHALLCCSTPADFGAVYETVSIPAADGVTLAGWFIPPTAEHGATILILHGAGGNRVGGMWHAQQLASAGYGVLLYDQRALGESTGDQQSWGWLDARDMPYILDFVAAQPGVNAQRIGGIGLSLGAHILLMAASDNPRLAALWLDGLQAGSVEDLPPSRDLGEGFQTLMSQLMIYAMDFQVEATPPPPARTLIPQLAPLPMMLVVGRLEEIEYLIHLGYTPLLGENAEQWIIDNAGHTAGPAVIPDEYAARMITFFDAALVNR